MGCGPFPADPDPDKKGDWIQLCIHHTCQKGLTLWCCGSITGYNDGIQTFLADQDTDKKGDWIRLCIHHTCQKGLTLWCCGSITSYNGGMWTLFWMIRIRTKRGLHGSDSAFNRLECHKKIVAIFNQTKTKYSQKSVKLCFMFNKYVFIIKRSWNVQFLGFGRAKP